MQHDTDLAFAMERIETHQREVAHDRLTRRPSGRISGVRRVVGGWFIALGRAIAVPAAPQHETGAR